MAIGILELLFGIISILLLLYYYFVKDFDYWEKLHIPGPKPIPLFGNFKDVIFSKIDEPSYIKSIYERYTNEPVVGLYMRSNPVLLLKDLDLIKDVLIKSFGNFADRGVKIVEDIDPLSQHLFYLEPKRWKPLRKRLTPAFTSGKLKEMLYLINDCADHFNQYLQRLADTNEPLECQELTSKFTTDVIGVCAFGLNMNTLANGESEFRKMGQQVFAVTWFNKVRRSVRFLPRWLGELIKPIARDDKLINFFVSTLMETMEYREKNNVRRHDFVDLLMEVRDHPESIGDEQMSELFLTAQAYIFFIAGLETSSTTMSNLMYELALNPEIQDKLREEVNATYAANDGKLSYDGIKSMKYLDKVFKETLRKYPPLAKLIRKSISDHTFPGTKIFIPKGIPVIIPVYALQHDPTYYPNPDKFDPERFDEAVENDRNHMTFLPFGDGPRNCIGERLGYIQSKVGLAMIIRNFKLEVCEKTCKKYTLRPGATILSPIGGLYLKLNKI